MDHQTAPFRVAFEVEMRLGVGLLDHLDEIDRMEVGQTEAGHAFDCLVGRGINQADLEHQDALEDNLVDRTGVVQEITVWYLVLDRRTVMEHLALMAAVVDGVVVEHYFDVFVTDRVLGISLLEN